MSSDVDVRRLRADDLRYLLAVASTGRLVAAADALGVDHTTVSRRIKALEKILQVRLLERGADGWELTEIGRAVAEPARPIQEAVERAALAASGMREDAVSGNFRLTAPDGFGTVFAVPALKRLRDTHPNLTIELITATRNLILHQSGFDLAVAVGKPATGRLFAEKLADYALRLYASEEYLERHGTPQTVGDLARHTVAFYVDSLLQVGDLDLDHHLPGVTARFASTNIFAQLEAARVGAGIALVPQFLALRAPELRVVDVGVPPLMLAFTLAVRRDSTSRPAVRAVRGALHEEVRLRRDELL
ncbi:LysR family transcriptional regulator [Pseudonocardia broussonetiae]|uniref:LysR family transcriptional regulator n=1 Tax=Pseudonocardia broussonetiae TaxID=2736640 RepID=A0A6M6JN11_9PSEU|nr:LysR family transcriptional regulator [Pseudonocardia broussonetiae]QJY48012.1 LysR family transcriptional regulator [Pseudonocardia broussonetiae]